MPRPAAAVGGLDRDGPADSSPNADDLVEATVSGSVRPGTPGTPAASAARRELILSPMTSMASGGGPMKVTPAAVMARAKSVFSEKKP